MNACENERAKFNPETVPLVGSLGILAIGDIGFEAWRKVKVRHNLFKRNEKE